MEIRRIILYAALGLVLFYLWNAWQQDYPPVSTKADVITEQSRSLLPSMQDAGKAVPLKTQQERQVQPVDESEVSSKPDSQIIDVKTDTLNLKIDLKDASIIEASLLQYPVSADEKDKPVKLLFDTSERRYVAQSNIFTVDGNNINILDFDFTAEKSTFTMDENQDSVVVSLTGTNKDGIKAIKQFVLNKGSYLINVNYTLENTGNDIFKGYFNARLLQSAPVEDKSSIFHVGSYTGASYSNPPQHNYKKISFKDMGKSSLDTTSRDGWVAMQQHYFLSAWIPQGNMNNRFYTRSFANDYTIGIISEPIILKPQEATQFGSKLYLGPEIASDLKSIAPHLDMTIDYGWLWFLSSLLFSAMKIIYSFVGNWGWSIIFVTLLIKLAFYRLSATSYKSMAGMRKLQPKLQSLRERYGDDKAKMSQATMELYRQEKVNPLGGCLPILIQIPVFIALYWVLLESVELRQASFLWLNDLAAPDPYHILPIVMGGTMLIQQKLNPAPPDPTQAKIMMFLPILFTALFWNFPSGLVLYWTVNNALSILQQWYITQNYDNNSNIKPKSKKLATAK